MAQQINLEELLARNRRVDAEQLKERLQMSEKLGRPRGRYRYNLVPPFGRRLRRQPTAEVGGGETTTSGRTDKGGKAYPCSNPSGQDVG